MGSPSVAQDSTTSVRGGSFAVESMAAFPWNQWQACDGISGSVRMEQVAALPWNQWQDSPGISGSFGVEYAQGLPGNPGCLISGDHISRRTGIAVCKRTAASATSLRP